MSENERQTTDQSELTQWIKQIDKEIHKREKDDYSFLITCFPENQGLSDELVAEYKRRGYTVAVTDPEHAVIGWGKV